MDPEEESLVNLGGGEDDVHHQETAVGGWSQAIEEARRAARSAQATAKADKFDLEAAIARAKRRSLADGSTDAVPESPTSGTRKVEVVEPAPAAKAVAVETAAAESAESAPARPSDTPASATPASAPRPVVSGVAPLPLMALLLDLTLILALILTALAQR